MIVVPVGASVQTACPYLQRLEDGLVSTAVGDRVAHRRQRRRRGVQLPEGARSTLSLPADKAARPPLRGRSDYKLPVKTSRQAKNRPKPRQPYTNQSPPLPNSGKRSNPRLIQAPPSTSAITPTSAVTG